MSDTSTTKSLTQRIDLNAILQATLDATTDGILAVDGDGNILVANTRFCEMWGLPAHLQRSEEALALVLPLLKHPEAFLARVRQIYQQPNAQTRDLIELKDGRVFDRHSRPQTIDDRNLGRVWTFSDITQRLTAERALRDSEYRYRTLLAAEQRHVKELDLLDRVRTAVAGELDLAAVFRVVVEAIASTFGFARVRVYLRQGETLMLQHQLGHETLAAVLPIADDLLGRVARSGQPELATDLSNGNYSPLVNAQITSRICVPLLDGGQTAGLLVAESDGMMLGQDDLRLMTALSAHVAQAIIRARLFTEARDSEALFRGLFEEAPIGMAITAPDGRFLRANHALRQMLGYTESELLAMNREEVVDAADRARDLEHTRRLLAGSIPDFGLEERYRHRNGAAVDVFLHATLLRDAEGNPRHFVAQTVDISELKQAEEAIRQAQKTESLGVLAGGVAHDFNNLLVAIMGQTSLALAKMDPENTARPHIAKSLAASERAADLTRQLLAYSGRGQFEVRALHLNELIAENLHLFEVGIPKHIFMVHRLEEQLPYIEADAGQMQQVVMNLIINAAEAIGDEPGTITVATRTSTLETEHRVSLCHSAETLAPGLYVVVEVIDNGCGMDDETLGRIFDPFYTTKFTGRGLGLAAVLGIVRGHNGGLEVDSVAGEGTTFRLYFPASDMTPINDVVADRSLTHSPDDSTILVIDDEEAVREAIADILHLEGYGVLTAANGVDGINLLQGNPERVRLVLLDLSMPGLSGAETLLALRSIHPTVPVIITSGHAESEAARRFDGQDLAGFVQKPYSAARLVEQIGHILG